MFTRVNIPNQNSTSMTGWPMSRSCQSRSCCLLDVLEIVIDSVMDPTFHVTMSHTSPFNHQICQRQIQPSMVESVHVLPQIHQPWRNLPRRSLWETHSRANTPRPTLNLHPATAELAETTTVATTTRAGTQQQSAKSNATTQEKWTKETHNKSSTPECNNIFSILYPWFVSLLCIVVLALQKNCLLMLTNC